MLIWSSRALPDERSSRAGTLSKRLKEAKVKIGILAACVAMGCALLLGTELAWSLYTLVTKRPRYVAI